DGIIARVENPRLAVELAGLDIPVVDVCGFGRMPGVPSFGTDQEVVARMAFEHLHEKGLKSFAYYGHPGVPSSDQREAAFTACVAEHGLDISIFPAERIRPNALIENVELQVVRREVDLAQWLHSLAKPVGLFAYSDLCAQQILHVCVEENISVPGSVAVVGVDNDKIVCDLCTPSLSSVQVNNVRTGWLASATLDQMMAGDKVVAQHSKVPPLRVVSRESTDVLATTDEETAEALQYIKAHACRGITADDVVRQVVISPATLRRRFAKLLGRSVKEEIDRVRINNSKRLLTETDLPLVKIASRSGYEHVETFCRSFLRTVGQTPGEYRIACKT
ncbi:MAG: substrate-binding domain-containing protein, partial [bacterium]|nr:substrate-binding domain-containing protein [bacterium]